MRFPWVNTILLILLLAQLVTGWLGFVNGMERRAWVLWAHGIGAYAITVLFFWKGSVIWQALSRRRRSVRHRLASLLLLGLLLAALLLGLIWSFAGPQYLFGFSLLTLHIFLAVPLIFFLTWHSWRLRWIWRLPASRNRRLFMRGGLLGLSGLVVWWLSRRTAAAFELPGSARRFTGSYEVGSFTGQFPATSWIADRPEPLSPDRWRLTVAGAVDNPRALSYEQLLSLPVVERIATLDCTGGFFTTQRWRGIPLAALLDNAGPWDEARSVTVRSVTGYSRRFTLREARDCLLATHIDADPLTHGHGFPLRLVVPYGRGYTWVKWVNEIRLNESAAIWQPPLPLQ